MHSQHNDIHSTSKRDSLKLLAGGFLATSSVLMACGGGSGSSTESTVTGTSTDAATTPGATGTAANNTLWIPPQLSGTTAAGVTTYELTLAASSVQFQAGAARLRGGRLPC